jgi:hypothetical protein
LALIDVEQVHYGSASPLAANAVGARISSVRQLSVVAIYQRPAHTARGPNHREVSFLMNSTKSFALAAVVAGLLGGTAVRVSAQQTTQNNAPTAHAGVLVAQSTPDTTKHSCKGKNDCKGQGGGKHPGKNSCKGKGGCSTDGSTPPKAA